MFDWLVRLALVVGQGQVVGEVVLQAFVDEAVATADALEEEAIGAVVKEAGVVPGDLAGGPEDEAEGEVLDAGESAT